MICFGTAFLSPNTSQISWPFLALTHQIKSHRCIPSIVIMHQVSQHAYMMVTTSKQWTACALSPLDPSQVPCKSCVTLSAQFQDWLPSALCHPKVVKGFWPAQNTHRAPSHLHRAYCVSMHWVELLPAMVWCPIPDNFSAYQWSLLGEDFAFKSDKLKLSSKRKVIFCGQMRWQTLAFQKNSTEGKNQTSH